MSQNKKANNSRRNALIGMTGAVGSLSLLPGKWTMPVIDTVILPAHAQTSSTTTVVPTTTVAPTTTSAPTTTPAPTTTLAPVPVMAVLDGVVDGVGGTAFTVDASASTGPSGATLSFMFSTGGNCTVNSQSGATAEIMRGVPGTCTVTVTVTDGNTSDTVSASANITVPLPPPSDIRLKTDIQELVKTTNGHQLYRFKYLDDPAQTEYVGVMAQEILKRYPQAVITSENGYYAVYYDRLGLRMTTYENWQERGSSSVQL